MHLNLEGRVAVITGGGAGIGNVIAQALAAEGCIVHIADRNAAAAQAAVADLQRSGAKADAVTLDVGDAASVTQAFQKISEARLRLDILINAAGLLSTGTISDLPMSEWDRLEKVSIAGVLHCVKAAIPGHARTAPWPHHWDRPS